MTHQSLDQMRETLKRVEAAIEAAEVASYEPCSWPLPQLEKIREGIEKKIKGAEWECRRVTRTFSPAEKAHQHRSRMR